MQPPACPACSAARRAMPPTRRGDVPPTRRVSYTLPTPHHPARCAARRAAREATCARCRPSALAPSVCASQGARGAEPKPQPCSGLGADLVARGALRRGRGTAAAAARRAGACRARDLCSARRIRIRRRGAVAAVCLPVQLQVGAAQGVGLAPPSLLGRVQVGGKGVRTPHSPRPATPSSPRHTVACPRAWGRRVLLRIKTYLPSWEAGPSDLNEWLDTFAAEQAPRRPRAPAPPPAPLPRPAPHTSSKPTPPP